MLKYFVFALTFLWMCLFLCLGVSSLLMASGQIIKDKAFFEKSFRPRVEFVKKFKSSYNRLPTDEEFEEKFNDTGISLFTYIRGPERIISNDTNKFTDANWQNDFAIGVWRGEWEEYYFSWTDNYDRSKYSWKDAITEFFICAFIGITPLVIFSLIKRKWLLGAIRKPSHS